MTTNRIVFQLLLVSLALLISNCNIYHHDKINPEYGNDPRCDSCSFKIIQEGKKIGYVIRDTDNSLRLHEAFARSWVRTLENIIDSSYGTHYNDFYRLYAIYENPDLDTIFSISFLNKREIRSFNLWCCEYHEVGKHYFRKHEKGYPSYFYFVLKDGKLERIATE